METIQILILKAFIGLLLASNPGTSNIQKQDAINQALSAAQQAQTYLAELNKPTPIQAPIATGGPTLAPEPVYQAPTQQPVPVIAMTLGEFLTETTSTVINPEENQLNNGAKFIPSFKTGNNKWLILNGKLTWFPSELNTSYVNGEISCNEPTLPFTGRVSLTNHIGFLPDQGYHCSLTLTDDTEQASQIFYFSTKQ